jgi:hypothetical protein
VSAFSLPPLGIELEKKLDPAWIKSLYERGNANRKSVV